MRKGLVFILLALVMAVGIIQTGEAASSYDDAVYPNGNYVLFWPSSYFDGSNHVVITYDADGNAYATALNSDGSPSESYYQYYQTSGGFLYYSSDGHTWYLSH